MKVISLVENTAVSDTLASEHGLSLYIETTEKKILFDMGQTDLFIRNAERLGIDLSCVDFAVLSHGHYDHGGGMASFFRINHHAPVYISSHAFEPHLRSSGKNIGIDPLLKKSDRLIYTDADMTLHKGISLLHYSDQQMKYEPGNFDMYVIRDGHEKIDDLKHEQYLMIEENGKRIFFSGCSHRGILNIEEWFQPDILIGGFHMMHIEDEAKLLKYAACLNSFSTAYYTCHCTGLKQYAFLKNHMDHLEYLCTGMTIEI